MSFDLAFVDSIGDVYDTLSDPFTRVVASGWDGAPWGQSWTVSSTSECTVNGSQGLMSLASVGSSRTARITTSDSDQIVRAEATLPVVPTGGPITLRVGGRATGFSNFYEAWLEIAATTGAATISLRKTVASTGTFLTSPVSAGTHSAGNTWAIELRVVGSNLSARAWKTSGTQPNWQTFATDTDLTSGVEVGVLARLETGNTNTLPVVVAWDNLSVTSPTQERLDLNDDISIRCLADGTDFGVPELDRAYADTLLADGAIVPAAAYGNRVLQLKLRFMSTPDANATALQSVIRELDRPNNFLRYRPATTSPVFFRTLRSAASAITWDPFSQEATIPILAEPFGYGQRIDLAPVTVNNDPAAGSNGMCWDVTGVQGDVETPPLIRITNTTPFGAGALSSVIAVRRRGTPSAMPLSLQCESMTLGNDTTLPGNDAVMSGAGSNYARCSFATFASGKRLSIDNFPTSPTNDARGRYRVWLRNRQNTGTDVIAVQLKYGAPGVTANIVNDAVTLASNTNRRWTDLGDFSIPIFSDPVEDGPSGIQMSPVGLGIEIDVQRVSGAGTFDMDALLFVPADDDYAAIGWSVVGAQQPAYLVLDSFHDMIYPMDAGPLMHSNNQGIPRPGSLPMLSPGQTNRIVLVMNATGPGAGNQVDSITHTATVAVSYWPRFASVARPVAS